MSAGVSDWHHVERAIREGDLEMLELLPDMIDGFPNGSDSFDRPWIYAFTESGTTEALGWALARGAPVDPEAPDGFPPLHDVIALAPSGAEEKSRMLIAAGADVNRRGMNDWTPLHIAAVRGNLAAIRVLLDAGADPSIRTRIDSYATPEEEARRLGQTEAADLIRDHVRERTAGGSHTKPIREPYAFHIVCTGLRIAP